MVTQKKFPVIFRKLGIVRTEIITLKEPLNFIILPFLEEKGGIIWRFRCSCKTLAKPGINTLLHYYLDDNLPNDFSIGECEELWQLILKENRFLEIYKEKDIGVEKVLQCYSAQARF